MYISNKQAISVGKACLDWFSIKLAKEKLATETGQRKKKSEIINDKYTSKQTEYASEEWAGYLQQLQKSLPEHQRLISACSNTRHTN